MFTKIHFILIGKVLKLLFSGNDFTIPQKALITGAFIKLFAEVNPKFSESKFLDTVYLKD